MTPALQAYITAWLEKAHQDLLSANRLMAGEPKLLENSCFHCQQSIEKYLKAFLIFNGREFERTHNIVLLLSECADFDEVFESIDPLNINAYAVHGRYPDFDLSPTSLEVNAFYELASKIQSLVLARVKF